VLYGCEACLLILRGKCGIRVFENRILMRIFGPKRDENGDWRRLHKEEFHSLYRSSNIVRVIKFIKLKWVGHVARMKEDSSFKMLTGALTRKRTSGKSRRR
jgi:hypothetical protein